jgi:hypothetical protein
LINFPVQKEEKMMNTAFSYACKDCEGMEACPGKVIAATKDEVWKLMELHAVVAHGEDPSSWDADTRAYLGTLIKPA